MIDVRMTQGSILRRVSSVAMKVMNPGNIDAQPTASVGHHAWEEYVRAKLPILDLDGGDAGGDTKVSITHDGHEAILEGVVGPGLIAVNTCVDIMCVSIAVGQEARPLHLQKRPADGAEGLG